MNSFIIQWNHLVYKDTFCCNENKCFRLLVKMDMSISKKGLASQLEPFEKPSFVLMLKEASNEVMSKLCIYLTLFNEYKILEEYFQTMTC